MIQKWLPSSLFRRQTFSKERTEWNRHSQKRGQAFSKEQADIVRRLECSILMCCVASTPHMTHSYEKVGMHPAAFGMQQTWEHCSHGMQQTWEHVLMNSRHEKADIVRRLECSQLPECLPFKKADIPKKEDRMRRSWRAKRRGCIAAMRTMSMRRCNAVESVLQCVAVQCQCLRCNVYEPMPLQCQWCNVNVYEAVPLNLLHLCKVNVHDIDADVATDLNISRHARDRNIANV